MIGTLQLAIPLQHPVFFLGLDTNTILLIRETRSDFRSFDNGRFFLEIFFTPATIAVIPPSVLTANMSSLEASVAVLS
jgi:hypothetical protein